MCNKLAVLLYSCNTWLYFLFIVLCAYYSVCDNMYINHLLKQFMGKGAMVN